MPMNTGNTAFIEATDLTNDNLRKLFDIFIDFESRHDRISLSLLTNSLKDIPLSPQDFGVLAAFDESGYRRNLLYDTAHFRALLLCWRSGQRSPIHNHRGSDCFVRVIAGTATEVAFKRAMSGKLSPTKVTRVSQGEICASSDMDIHIIGNFEKPGTNLISLHVYTPPLLGMETFSIEETIFGDDRSIVQHALSSVDNLTAKDWAFHRKESY